MTYSAGFRIVSALAYGAIVVLIAATVEGRIGCAAEERPEVERKIAIIGPLSVHHVAARDLPAHHRLSSRDLVAGEDLPVGLAARMEPTATLAGRYLLAPIPSGGLVGPADVADRPRPSVPRGQRLVSIPIDSAVLHRLEVGMRVTLRYGDSASAPALKVLALDCGPPDGGDSAADASDCDLLVSMTDSLWNALRHRSDGALSIDPALALDSKVEATLDEEPVPGVAEEDSDGGSRR